MLNLRKDKTRMFFGILVILAVLVLLISWSLRFNFNKIIDGGDTQVRLSPEIFLKKGLTTWDNTGMGGPYPFLATELFYTAPLYLLNKLFTSISISLFIYDVGLFAIAPISIFILSYLLTKDIRISALTILFYCFNLYTSLRFYTPVSHSLYSFGALPLLVLLFYISIKSNGFKQAIFLFITAIFFLPLLRTPQIFLIYLILIPFFAISFLLIKNTEFKINKIYIKKITIKIILLFLLVFLLSMPFLYKLILTIDILNNSESQKYTSSAIKVLNGQTMIKTFMGAYTYAWDKQLYVELPGIQSFSFIEEYQKNPIYILLTFVPLVLVLIVILIFYSILERKQRIIVICVLILALITIFIMNIPIDSNTSNATLQIALRSLWKYLMPVVLFCFSFILMLILFAAKKKFDRRSFCNMLNLFLICYLLYILPTVSTGKFINSAWCLEVPTEYGQLAEFFNQQDSDFRILPVPITKHPVGYTPYVWGYAGPDILYAMIDKSLIDKYTNTFASEPYLKIIKELDDSSMDKKIEIAKSLNVKYIFIRTDINTTHKYIKFDSTPEEYEKYLSNSKEVKAVYYFKNLVLFELKEFNPQILAFTNENWSKWKEDGFIGGYTKYTISEITINNTKNIDPTTWEVQLSARKPFILSFSTAYNSKWEAHVYKENTEIEVVKSTPLYNTINAFHINTTGDLKIMIDFAPQKTFELLMGITIIVIVVYSSIVCLLFLKEHKK